MFSILFVSFIAFSAETPIQELNIHLIGIHPEKENPIHQPIAHHFCQQVNEDFAQCVLYDGDSKTANMMGIEYIISEKVFESLPANEKQYWHPHNYEILSGALNVAGVSKEDEKNALKGKMNSYGKTFHTWKTPECCHGGTKLPLGKPTLQWSLNHDGEASPETLKKITKVGIDLQEKRTHRADLASIAKPQNGVNALKGKFPKAQIKDMPGITHKE